MILNIDIILVIKTFALLVLNANQPSPLCFIPPDNESILHPHYFVNLSGCRVNYFPYAVYRVNLIEQNDTSFAFITCTSDFIWILKYGSDRPWQAHEQLCCCYWPGYSVFHVCPHQRLRIEWSSGMVSKWTQDSLLNTFCWWFSLSTKDNGPLSLRDKILIGWHQFTVLFF